MLLGASPDRVRVCSPTFSFNFFSMLAKKKPARITRSISFTRTDFAYITRKAAKLNRTFNWVVNDLIRADVENASVAAATSSDS